MAQQRRYRPAIAIIATKAMVKGVTHVVGESVTDVFGIYPPRGGYI